MSVALVLLLTAAVAAAALITFPGDAAKPVTSTYNKYVLVIDPGHGGADGGAVSADGHKESDVNLAVALKMSALCDFMGVEHKLTRSTDSGCNNSEGYSEHDELVARADTANSTPNAILISIHQNKYPSELVHGAEVMYAKTPLSRELGLITQSNLVSALDPENRRVAHEAPEELLLTRSVSCPAILAECGFMSNTEEAARLVSGDYQMKLAAVLVSSFAEFCCGRLTA